MFLASPVVDWAAIGKVLAAALIVGVGVTALFGLAVRSGERLRADDQTAPGPPAVVDWAVIVVTAIVCIAAIVIGFVAMTHK